MKTSRYPQAFSSIFGRLVEVLHSAQQLVIEDASGVTHTIAPSRDPASISTWFSTPKLLIGRQVSFVSRTKSAPDGLQRTPWIILEPDFVIDITEAAQLVGIDGISPSQVLVKRLRPHGSMSLALTGSLVNTAFDILVRQPEMPDAEIIHEALATRPLSVASAWKDQSLSRVINAMHAAMPALHTMYSSFGSDCVVLEPHYISPTFGLQGRADILLRGEGTLRVIEMKAGRPASGTGVRPDHASQVAGYATLVEATERGSTIDSCIWYVQDSVHPLREVESSDAWFTSLVIARNVIVANDIALTHRSAEPLRRIRNAVGVVNRLGSSYDEQAQHSLSDAYAALDRTEALVVRAWLGFTTAEHEMVRIGGGTSRATADLWRQGLDHKHTSSTVITDLVLDADLSDLSSMHLVFAINCDIGLCALRIGDPVILHPERGGSSAPCDGALLKASLRGISSTHVEISLRNKHIDGDELIGHRWILEQDVLDTTVRSYYTAIRSFMDATPDRRQVILGRRNPRHDAICPMEAPDLTIEQREIVERALAAKELFLIQGPPGTGKTSAVLRSIIATLTAVPGERILAVAYTNRAANEISAVLTRHGIAHVRHGSSEGAHAEVSIPTIGRQLSPEQLATVISKARCVVSTVQSLFSSSEIWDFGDFTSVVIDEASQILEPHIVGITSRIPRAILIGDHCQLPAVVTQKAEALSVRGPEFEAIAMSTLGMSAFERLVRCARLRNDEDSVAMLTHQGRMHDNIMRFVSTQFYDGRLTSLAPWQSSNVSLPWSSFIPHRSVVIPIINDADQMAAEAVIVINIAKRIHDIVVAQNYPCSIGIITPFRVQNNAISRLLPEDLRREISVDTVERFQGSERDVIIYATAISSIAELESISSEIQFEGRIIDRKLNVAMTRARQQFILVGNTEILRHARAYAAAIQLLPSIHIPSIHLI